MTTRITFTTIDGSKHSLDLPDADAQTVATGLKNTWVGTPDPNIKGAYYANLGATPSWVVKAEAITAVDLVAVPSSTT